MQLGNLPFINYLVILKGKFLINNVGLLEFFGGFDTATKIFCLRY